MIFLEDAIIEHFLKTNRDKKTCPTFSQTNFNPKIFHQAGTNHNNSKYEKDLFYYCVVFAQSAKTTQ